MPHVIVKMRPGRSEQQKAELAAAIVKDVMFLSLSRRSRRRIGPTKSIEPKS
jgi:hypothetical protein